MTRLATKRVYVVCGTGVEHALHGREKAVAIEFRRTGRYDGLFGSVLRTSERIEMD